MSRVAEHGVIVCAPAETLPSPQPESRSIPSVTLSAKERRLAHTRKHKYLHIAYRTKAERDPGEERRDREEQREQKLQQAGRTSEWGKGDGSEWTCSFEGRGELRQEDRGRTSEAESKGKSFRKSD